MASNTCGPLTPSYCQYQEQGPCWGWGVSRSQVHWSGTVYHPPCEPQFSPHWRSLDFWRPNCLADSASENYLWRAVQVYSSSSYSSTIPQMHRYTTLWNVCAQKWPCFRAVWSKLPCKIQTCETVVEKHSSNFVKWRNNTYSGHTEKPKESPIKSTHLLQPRRKTSRPNACVRNQHSDSHWWHQSQVKGCQQLTSLILWSRSQGYWGLLS